MPARHGVNHARTVFLETFGCQMNELDSELVQCQLTALGYRFVAQPDAADVVLYNTCSVRQQAENKVLSRLGLMALEKAEGRQVIVGVLGCMAEREGLDMIRKYPHIDLMCGPGELDKLPWLLDNAMKTELVRRRDLESVVALQGNRSRRSATLAAAQDNLELLDLSRAFDPDGPADGGRGHRGNVRGRGRSALVRITRGCNKFCTYCVVPHTRGAEVHRPPDHVVDECRRLADAGVIEITLLGQTVNHYVYVHGPAVSIDGREVPQVGPGAGAFAKNGQRARSPLPLGEGLGVRVRTAGDDESDAPSPQPSPKGRGSRTTTFADLLKRIHDEVPAIRRLRFVTSYPRDFGDDILHVMAQSPRICRYLHVPAQSGSNRILKLMNRGYTVEQYLDFIGRARAILPDVSIAGDIIVGFPTETEADFEQTRDLLRRARCKNQFIFKYSPRPGTVAIDRFVDDVPEAVKRRRNNELLDLQLQISARMHAEFVGQVVDVFVEKAQPMKDHRTGDPLHGGARVMTPGGGGMSGGGGGRVELGWAPRTAPVQLSGRTAGDLIAAFSAPGATGQPSALEHMIGTIVPVRITGSGPLILFGELLDRDQRSPESAPAAAGLRPVAPVSQAPGLR